MRSITLALPPASWTDVGGQAAAKAALADALAAAGDPSAAAAAAAVGARPPAGILLHGPPGCSKTLLARAAATEGGRNFFGVKAGELLAPWVGDSEKAVASLFASARAAAPSVVFFDEVDGLAPPRDDDGGGGGAACARIVAQLLVELDSGARAASAHRRADVLVVAATNRPDRVEPALLRPGRFDRRLYVRPPESEGDRAEVLAAASRGVPLAPDVDFATLAASTPGFTGADLAAVVRGACLAAVEEGDAGADAVGARHFQAALATAAPSPPPPPELAAMYAAFERTGGA